MARGRGASGKRTVNYRLRDWLVSRQRYWGCPIPVVYCPDDGIVPVPEDQLPVLRPTTSSSSRPGSRRSPRTRRSCTRRVPTAAGRPSRETDTMDTFVDSSAGTSCGSAIPFNPDVPVRPGGRPPLDAGRPVHRRHRARHPAPALRPLLHPGPDRRRARPRRAARAVPAAVHPGHDPHGRHEDVEVQGQPDRPGASTSTPSAPTPCGSSTSSSGRRPTTSTGPSRPTR